MASADLPRRVGIVGLGLMGGSVARALKTLDPPPRVVAFTRDASDAQTAVREGILDQIAGDPAEAVVDQDLIVYATPLGVAVDLMATHAELLGNAAITDVVGLKVPLLEQAREGGFADRYVGAHPMVGGTGSAFGASTHGLFVDRTVWMVAGDASGDRVESVENVWRSFGARTRAITAEEHDRSMVWASHLPQLLAMALARMLAAQGLQAGDLGAGGLEMTRLAMSSSEMWSDLLDVSVASNALALGALQEELALMQSALEHGSGEVVGDLMDQIRGWREDA